MDKRLIGLKMLSSFKNSEWKIGQSDFYINSITSRVAVLPAHIFNNFYINNDSSRPISTVDFALMTYDMGSFEKNRLMELYDIDASTIDEILKAADDISEFLDTFSEQPVERASASPFDDASDNKKMFKAFNDDEFEI